MDRSERLGLGVSTAGHVLLFGALSLGLLQTRVSFPPPPAAIDVSLADDVALQSATPDPSEAPPPAATAPELGQTEPDAAPPEPAPAEVVEPPPAPRPMEPARTKPQPRAETKPTPAKVQPAPRATARPQRASRLGRDFLKGLDSENAAPGPSAAPGVNAAVSPVAARALNAEINRQIKPFWKGKAPTGADAEQLVTIVAVDLNRDGSLAGAPRVVTQTGVTPSNRAQTQLHSENAVRAVRLAAPFRLPPDLYDAWRSLEIRFDKRLSQ